MMQNMKVVFNHQTVNSSVFTDKVACSMRQRLPLVLLLGRLLRPLELIAAYLAAASFILLVEAMNWAHGFSGLERLECLLDS